jgi:hypothetical protein
VSATKEFFYQFFRHKGRRDRLFYELRMQIAIVNKHQTGNAIACWGGPVSLRVNGPGKAHVKYVIPMCRNTEDNNRQDITVTYIQALYDHEQ